MLTFQDFEKARTGDMPSFISKAIAQHTASAEYRIAVSADAYDRQKNETIYNYVQTIFTATGSQVVDFTAANNRIASNFFHRLNTQRCMYSLGNGVSFANNREKVIVDGVEQTVDKTKQTLGSNFDTALKKTAYKALIHGVCFGFWNFDTLYTFPLTEFVPLWDENTGALRAGIRFWQLDSDKPMTAILYEEDGLTKYRGTHGGGRMRFEVIEDKKPYKQRYTYTDADGLEVVGGENYGTLPIVPLWGSDLHQSTLVGMQRAIDSYDLIRSGFANDLTDCAQIYWILSNCSGMKPADLARFRDRLKIQHIAVVDADESAITPYTQEIPYQARQTYLEAIKAGIYEDFGGLDVHTVAAGSTNDHLNAAYQPLDENADDFEYQIICFVQQILALIGIDDTPLFQRNRISNQFEQVQMVMLEADHLDSETILQKLPNITADEIPGILARQALESSARFKIDTPPEDDDDEEEQETQA
jgi:hypothetical protein